MTTPTGDRHAVGDELSALEGSQFLAGQDGQRSGQLVASVLLRWAR